MTQITSSSIVRASGTLLACAAAGALACALVVYAMAGSPYWEYTLPLGGLTGGLIEVIMRVCAWQPRQAES